jgi:iron(III) transport system permease protein
MNPPRYLRLAIISSFTIIVLLPIFFMIIAPLVMHSAHGFETPLFNERHLDLARNSLSLASGTTLLSVMIGVPLAFLLSRANLWGKALFGILYLIPILIPPYTHAIVWCRLEGRINTFLSLDIHSLFGAIVVLSLAYFPFVTLMTISGIKSIDRSLEEASLMRHGPWRTLKDITLPLASPHIFSGSLFVFIFSIVDFGVPDILRVNVYPVEIFIQFGALYDERAAALLSFPLITITLILVLLQRWHMRARSYVNLTAGSGRSITYELRGLHPLAFTFCLIVFSLSAFIPVAVLIEEAGLLSNYIRVLSSSIDQISYSIVLAALGGLVTVSLALFISYMIERGKTRAMISLELASLIPFAIPGITLGIGLIKVWNRPIIDILYGCPFIIVLGYVARFIPFTVRATSSGIKQINPHLEEAGLLGGSSWMRVITRIAIPLSWPSLMAGFFITFILSLGELGTTLLIIPPGRETIPIKIYNLMHYGADQMVAALCLILVGITLAFSALFLVSYRRAVKVFR